MGSFVAIETEVSRGNDYGLHDYSNAVAQMLEAGAPNISFRLHRVLDFFQSWLLRDEVGRHEAMQEGQTKHDQHTEAKFNLIGFDILVEVEVLQGDIVDVATE